MIVINSPVLAQTNKVLKIGVVYPFSGAMGLVSEGIIAGHRAAANEIMKNGGFQGHKVEFLVRDDTGNPELNTRFCKELIINDKVDWIFSGFGSSVGLSATAVAKQLKTPTFIIGGATEKITCEEWNPYIFRYRPTSTAEANAVAKIVASQMTKGIKDPKIYFISWDYEYGKSLHKPFMKKIKELKPDVRIVGEAWPRTGETDYGPFISHMISTRPDVVVNIIWAGGVISLLKQGASRGLWEITKFIGTAEPASIEYRKAMGMDMPEGAWGNTYDDPTWPDNEMQRKLYDSYYKDTGKPRSEPPPAVYSPGYYMVQLVNKAMEKAGTVESESVIKAMEGVEIDTHLGRIKIRDFDHQVTSYYIWGPMVTQKGLPYKVLDKERIQLLNCEPDLYSKAEWLEIRKAAGKE
jgi:branched-chain amino acid transport system substrate-binding protein